MGSRCTILWYSEYNKEIVMQPTTSSKNIRAVSSNVLLKKALVMVAVSCVGITALIAASPNEDVHDVENVSRVCFSGLPHPGGYQKDGVPTALASNMLHIESGSAQQICRLVASVVNATNEPERNKNAENLSKFAESLGITEQNMNRKAVLAMLDSAKPTAAPNNSTTNDRPAYTASTGPGF